MLNYDDDLVFYKEDDGVIKSGGYKVKSESMFGGGLTATTSGLSIPIGLYFEHCPHTTTGDGKINAKNVQYNTISDDIYDRLLELISVQKNATKKNKQKFQVTAKSLKRKSKR